MTNQSQQLYFAAVRSDFKVLLKQAFATVYPGQPFDDNFHIDAIIDRLERCLRGKLQRLIINLPPRYLKSFITAVAWPAFILGLDPTAKIICISYSDELASAHARDFRRIVDSDWYRAVFAKTRLTKNTEGEIVTDQGGFRYATSVYGTLTGRGADVIIVDDPIKPEDAHSDRARVKLNQWFGSTLLSRLDDKKRSILVLVMQRVHVDDPAGHLQSSGDFHVLSFPAIAMRDEVIETRHGKLHQRRAGEALMPLREDVTLLNRIRRQMGEMNFAAQYQQRPQVPEGTIFKLKWFTRVTRQPQLDRRGGFVLSIDTALSDAETADYTAITLIYAVEGEYTVWKAERGHYDYETLKRRAEHYIRALAGKELPLHVLVEKAGAGISLCQHLWPMAMDGVIRLNGYTPKYSKVARAYGVLPIVEKGVFILDEGDGRGDWIEPFLSELTTFPSGRHDDWVDSFVYAIDIARARHGKEDG